MNGYRLAVVVALLTVGLAFVSVGAAIGDTSPSASLTEEEESASSMGEEMGAFMQSSTAEADGSIDRGMFESSLEEADNPDQAVRERITALEQEYEQLAEQSATLEGNSTLPEPARRAQLTRLAVQLDSLDTSINETEEHARAVGVDTARLDQLRQNASELAGPEIAEIAKGLAGIDPPGQGDGTPSDDNPGNDNAGSGDSGGPPDDPGQPGDDGTDTNS